MSFYEQNVIYDYMWLYVGFQPSSVTHVVSLHHVVENVIEITVKPESVFQHAFTCINSRILRRSVLNKDDLDNILKIGIIPSVRNIHEAMIILTHSPLFHNGLI